MYEKIFIKPGYSKPVTGNITALNGEQDIIKYVLEYLKDLKVLTTTNCDTLCSYKFDLGSQLNPKLVIDDVSGEIKLTFGANDEIETTSSLNLTLTSNIKTDEAISLKSLNPYDTTDTAFPIGTDLQTILTYLADLSKVNTLKEQQDDFLPVLGTDTIVSTKKMLPDTIPSVYKNGLLVEKSQYTLTIGATNISAKFITPFGASPGSAYSETASLVYFAQ
jgi:hypothetical protein